MEKNIKWVKYVGYRKISEFLGGSNSADMNKKK